MLPAAPSQHSSYQHCQLAPILSCQHIRAPRWEVGCDFSGAETNKKYTVRQREKVESRKHKAKPREAGKIEEMWSMAFSLNTLLYALVGEF